MIGPWTKFGVTELFCKIFKNVKILEDENIKHFSAKGVSLVVTVTREY
jgi:hypothetical protein